MLGTYKPFSQNEPNYVSEFDKLLTYYHSSYDNILLQGDFDMLFFDRNIKDLCDIFELNHLIKDLCFKSLNLSGIDNFCTNKKTTFFNSSTVRTGISDHHSLICTMLRFTLCKGPPKFICYKAYNNYDKEEFENVLKQILKNFFNYFCLL